MNPKIFNINMGIKQLVVLIALLPAIGISIFLSLYFNWIRIEELRQETHTKGTSMVSKLASLGKYSVLTGNLDALNTLLTKTINHEIVSASFFNIDGTLLATANAKNFKSNPTSLLSNKQFDPNTQDGLTTIYTETANTFLFTTPISLLKVRTDDYPQTNATTIDNADPNARIIIGWTQIEISKVPAKIKKYQALINSTLIIILGIIASSLLAIRLGREVTEPILKLSNAVAKISSGELDTTVYTNAKWELSILESGINIMTHTLKNAHEKMQYNIKCATAKLKAQNLELEVSRKEAEYASKVKSEFLTNISHELRTPLSEIHGFVHLLQKTTLNNKQTEYLNTIHKSSTNLLTIINNILDFSKIEYGTLQLNLELMDIRKCVDDALVELSPLAHDKKLELIATISSKVPKQIISDNLRIKQIITNLLSDSIKYTNSNHIIVSIDIVNETKDYISMRCNIIDSDIEISDLYKPKTLKHFRNFNNTSINTFKTFSSNGLGLIVCNKIITQMNGYLQIKKKQHNSSCFSFIFTTQKAINQPQSAVTIDEFNLPPAKVLLYDTNTITNQAISNILTSWGLIVTSITKLETLQQMLQQKCIAADPYKMIFLGTNDPLLDPLFTEEYFRIIKDLFLCPLGLLVNTNDHAIHSNLLRMGATMCLAKPIANNKLYNALCKTFIPHFTKHITSKEISDLKILVVDDNLLNLKLIVAFLENIGIKATTANSGIAALNLIDKQIFNLIFMDILMPDLNGIEVSNKIRHINHANKDTVIIALSAHIISDPELLKTAGINDYLTKPITESQLRATIYKWTQYDSAKEHKQLDHKVNINSIPSLDWQLSLKLATGKPQLAKDLFETMIISLPTEQRLINSAFTSNNLDDLREHVHKLHGSCCYTGFAKLKYIIKNLEQEIILKNHNNINNYIKIMNEEINFLISKYHYPAEEILC